MRRRPRADLPFATWALGAALTLAPAAAAGEERVAAGGLGDLEGWATDSQSEFPGRGEGDPSGSARLRAWLAADLGASFELYAQGRIEGGRASVASTTGPELEQGYLRYSFGGSSRFVLEAGRIVSPIGNFPRRYFSSVNPLIGAPVGYTSGNPDGVRLSGWAGLFDFTVAAVDRPWTYGADVPAPGRAFRPAVAFGVTPTTGLRLGVYGTHGPYIDGIDDAHQTVAGFDLHFSRGYFVLNGDASRSRYEIPEGAESVDGRTIWLEPVYTVHPRVFLAARIESSDLVYVDMEDGEWEAERLRLFDVEAGVGVRILPSLLAKITYRRTHWTIDDAALREEYPDGYALAGQVSYTFDIDGWFRKRR